MRSEGVGGSRSGKERDERCVVERGKNEESEDDDEMEENDNEDDE